jgi:sugar phosphate isomerase/epimerase
VKQALIVAFLGTVRDRFTQLGEPLTIREKLRRAALIPGVQGAEIIFPDECLEPSEVIEALAETGLTPAAINVNLKGRPEFQHGALSVSDPEIRKMAVNQILKAKEFAQRAGAERVTCAPLADGVDYPLQQNHAGAWKRTVQTLRTAIEEGPSVPLHLEHKPSDPRVHGLLSSSDIVLQLLHDIDREAAGITLNVGHASLDGLSPAASLAQVLDSGVPLYVHMCDAAGGWDWDLLPGSYHPWHLLEFLQALSASGYDGWLTSDSFPLRQEALVFSAAHIHRTACAVQAAENAPGNRLGFDGVLSWKELEAWLFPSN